MQPCRKDTKERLVDLLPDRWTPPGPAQAMTGTAALGVTESVA
jgi:hypothetical protein